MLTRAERKRLVKDHAAGCTACGGSGYVVHDAAFHPYPVECPKCRPYETVIKPLMMGRQGDRAGDEG